MRGSLPEIKQHQKDRERSNGDHSTLPTSWWLLEYWDEREMDTLN